MDFDFESARRRLEGIVRHTPLERNAKLSARHGCDVYLKREDRQVVRSYKLRGAYNLISQLPADQLARGVVCASAGNHAQGVALSCRELGARGVIFMPQITPKQKVRQTELFGAGQVEVILVGDTFDDCLAEALRYTEQHGMTFVPPFDHPRIIEGQGTVGIEILEDLPEVDVVLAPIGGGGLIAGVGRYLKERRPGVRILGAEPEGAPSMTEALRRGRPVMLEKIDRFVDGAAVRRVGELPFQITREVVDEVFTVPEGQVCKTILDLYNDEAIVAEPAGALSVAALEVAPPELIRGKNVVCVISGGNNDIDRMQEIKERALLYLGLKHYILVRFPQRPGALKHFVNNVLGPNDDITRFEFIKKSERESGPALVGIELKFREDYEPLIHRMRIAQFDFREVNKEDLLFEYFV
jgi:threonine dehydratase